MLGAHSFLIDREASVLIFAVWLLLLIGLVCLLSLYFFFPSLFLTFFSYLESYKRIVLYPRLL